MRILLGSEWPEVEGVKYNPNWRRDLTGVNLKHACEWAEKKRDADNLSKTYLDTYIEDKEQKPIKTLSLDPSPRGGFCVELDMKKDKWDKFFGDEEKFIPGPKPRGEWKLRCVSQGGEDATHAILDWVWVEKEGLDLGTEV